MAVRGSTEIKVGIFVFIGIIALLYLTFKLAEEAFTPKDVYKLYAVFDNISGLTKGAKIEMAGIPIGRVGNIELTSDGKAKVELLIYKDYKIQKDAKAAIRTYGVLGDKFVDIKPGTSSAYLQPGSMIAYTQGAISVDEILASIGPTVEGLKEILGSEEGKQNLKILVENIRDASQSFKNILQKIEKGQGTLSKLITDEHYFVWIIKYILENPVKAKLVKQISDWEFSNAKDLLKLRNGTLTDIKEVTSFFQSEEQMINFLIDTSIKVDYKF